MLLTKNEHLELTVEALRRRVHDLEAQLHTAAEEIVSYVQSNPILKEASHAARLEEDPEWALILGLGYTDAQKRDLIYRHLGKLKDELHRITGGDAMRAKQLSDLLYLRVHAGEKRRLSHTEQAELRRHDINEGIVASIYWFVQALHNAGGQGRYPDKIRQAQQVVATAVSNAAALSGQGVSVAEIGKLLGLNERLISKCKTRYDSLTDGEWEQLFDDRQAVRSDKMNDDWRNFALQFWTDETMTDEHGNALNFVRASEKASDEVRNPTDRKSSARYRIFWLEERIYVMHRTMLRMGKKLYGESFAVGWKYFLELRPFYVKDATRDTCMCIYHLRWREFANGLINYRKSMRHNKVSTCSCTWPVNEKWLRKQLVCQKAADSQSLDNIDCMLQRCGECKDARKLTTGPGSLCADEMRNPGSDAGDALTVHYESYEKLPYFTKDGTRKEKKDFCSVDVPFSKFKEELEKYWPKFIAHHNDAKWHDDDFTALKNKLPRGRVGIVIDYAENYSHEPRFEHQSKYFSQVGACARACACACACVLTCTCICVDVQVQTTIIPVVVMVNVEDLTNISEDERTVLIALFDQLSLPHVISETHYIISSDMQHDNAMIQKLLDDFIMPYIKANCPTVTEVHIRSDGCKAQFKCAANFMWVSRQKVDGCGLRINWSFFESCHGKCYCDPEGGTLKNAARHHELNIENPADQLKDSESFYKWACDKSGLETPKIPLKQKKGKGIYRRFFYWVPSKGTGAVDRSRLPTLKADGTSKLHEFVDVGTVGTVSTRRASCHQCDACWAGDRVRCENKAYVGAPVEIQITKEHRPAAAAERMDRAAVNRAAVERAERTKAGTVVCVETHKDEQTFPWVIGLVVTELQSAPAASVAYDPATDTVHFEPVKASEPALQVKLYEALQPGSTIYKLSEMLVWVPARRVRVIDVELEETRGSGRLGTAQNPRVTIEASSLLRIRAEMPTANEDWEVETVMQYRCQYGVEQWLVKWKGYDQDRNTWEPWDNLLTDGVRAEAQAARTAGLPQSREGLTKLVVVTLKAALEERGLDTSGQKAVLVDRLLAALMAGAV